MTVKVAVVDTGTVGFPQVTVIPVVDTALGVKIRLLVNCPAVLLVNMAVNPMAVKTLPTGSDAKNETPGAEKTPDRSVRHLRVLPVVKAHVQTLWSLSLGHRFSSLLPSQIKLTVAEITPVQWKKSIPCQIL